MNKGCPLYWRTDVWMCWHQKVYGETLSIDNFYDDGKIHQQDIFNHIDKVTTPWNPKDSDDRFYVKLVRGNEFFILPKRFIKQLPIQPIKTIKIKLKPADTQVWYYIQEVKSLYVEPKMLRYFRDYINSFNPVIHSNRQHWIMLRLIAHSQNSKLGVCSEVSSGKNINMTLRRYMSGSIIPKAKNMTEAKFYACLYYNDWVNCDEMSSWKADKVHLVEPLITDAGDDSPEMDKYAKDKKRAMEKVNVLNKSITFTFNRPQDLKNKEKSFENIWDNPAMVIDRYPLFLVTGKVMENIPKLSEGEVKSIMEQNFETMCNIASEEAYWKHHYHKHLHGWDRGVCVLQRRHLNNISPLLDRIDLYSESQNDFNYWVKILNKMYTEYKDMIVRENGHDYKDGRLV